MNNIAKILIIAGSDSGGGAGIQGDIKTVTCLGGYASTAITALTAQNTLGVFAIHDVPANFIAQQINLVLSDIGADAIKTGMLNKESVITTIADALHEYSNIPLILDPVMFAKGGAALLAPSALSLLKSRLIPLATIITPNIPEAEYLAEMSIKNITDMRVAAKKILLLGCKAVLLKGGHMESETVIDLLISNNEEAVFEQPRIHSKNTHGTGCTLASAIATGIAQKLSLYESVKRAREYVKIAIETAPNIGHGHGSLNHGHTVKNF